MGNRMGWNLVTKVACGLCVPETGPANDRFGSKAAVASNTRDVSFAPNTGNAPCSPALPRCAITGREQVQQGQHLFDHLVGTQKDRGRQS